MGTPALSGRLDAAVASIANALMVASVLMRGSLWMNALVSWLGLHIVHGSQ